jgi:hypothetical protein
MRDTRPQLAVATWPLALTMMAGRNRNQHGAKAMALSKSRLFASGLAVAGLAGAVALGYATPHWGQTFFASRGDQNALVQAAPPGAVQLVADKQKGTAPAATPDAKVDAGRNVLVEAPHTTVKVGKDSGKVAVRAPHTDVKVDPDKGRVQVRAPYVNLDIRW